ncbi:MAG: prolyl oligopeptidase family serine peptidase [Pseudomonadota bacterium]
MSRTPPRAAQRPVEREAHGVRWSDPYAWLRAENWREAVADPAELPADIRAHLEAENAYAKERLAFLEDDAEALFQLMKDRLDADEATPPTPDGPWAYYSQYRDGAQRRSFFRMPAAGGAPELLYDPDAEAEAGGAAYFQVGSIAHAPTHDRIAVTVDQSGSELFTLRIRDLESGVDGPVIADRADGQVVWTPDGRFVVYVERDNDLRPARVVVADAASGEPVGLLYDEKDPGFFLGVSTSRSRAFLFIAAHGHGVSETHALRLIEGEAPSADGLFCIDPRRPDVEYDVDHAGGFFYITTNADGAVDFRIDRAPDDAPDRRETLVPHVAGRMIEDVRLFPDHLVRLEREDAVPACVIRRLSNGAETTVPMEDAACALDLAAQFEFEAPSVRLLYQSPRTPPRFLDVDLETATSMVVLQRTTQGLFTSSDYVVSRLEAPAPDGEHVPVTLLHQAATPLDGSAPALLYGYGAYGVTTDARFSASRLAIADRGFVVALAHIRGGSDKGRGWYETGRREHKENTFTDFLAVARSLVEKGVAARGRIVAHGGSAGGMLVGAATAIDPQAFRAVLAEVPFVDVLNTMLDETLPLTPPEWPEWGDPIRDGAAFERIRRYSPYEAVRPGRLPHVFATAGVSDPRVTYWEPAKWVARLRDCNESDAAIVFETVMSGGHGGSSGRDARLKETARAFAFAVAATSGAFDRK